jgi:hypothetical protein
VAFLYDFNLTCWRISISSYIVDEKITSNNAAISEDIDAYVHELNLKSNVWKGIEFYFCNSQPSFNRIKE